MAVLRPAGNVPLDPSRVCWTLLANSRLLWHSSKMLGMLVTGGFCAEAGSKDCCRSCRCLQGKTQYIYVIHAHTISKQPCCGKQTRPLLIRTRWMCPIATRVLPISRQGCSVFSQMLILSALDQMTPEKLPSTSIESWQHRASYL